METTMRAATSGPVATKDPNGTPPYDHDNYRRELWCRGVKPSIARRGTKHGSGLGRWVVERTFAWPHNYHRLRIRWERVPAAHMALLTLARALICRLYLMRF
jgi:DDE family transposase